MSIVQIHSIFSTPLIHFKFSKHNEYHFDDIEKSVNKPISWQLDLNTSFPNINANDKFVVDLVAKNLKKDLIEDIQFNLKKLNYDKKINIFMFWYNVYHSNQGQEVHDHLGTLGDNMSFMSGIYFNKNSNLCKISFVREHGFNKLYDSKEFENSALDSFFWEEYFPNICDGDVLIFPPYLKHRVSPLTNEENKMRLTFAFNLLKSYED